MSKCLAAFRAHGRGLLADTTVALGHTAVHIAAIGQSDNPTVGRVKNYMHAPGLVSDYPSQEP